MRLSPPPLPNMMERYTKQEKAGQGTYGVVYKSWDNETNEFVALKVSQRKERRDLLTARLLRGIRSLSFLSAPHTAHTQQHRERCDLSVTAKPACRAILSSSSAPVVLMALPLSRSSHGVALVLAGRKPVVGILRHRCFPAPTWIPQLF